MKYRANFSLPKWELWLTQGNNGVKAKVFESSEETAYDEAKNLSVECNAANVALYRHGEPRIVRSWFRGKVVKVGGAL